MFIVDSNRYCIWFARVIEESAYISIKIGINAKLFDKKTGNLLFNVNHSNVVVKQNKNKDNYAR